MTLLAKYKDHVQFFSDGANTLHFVGSAAYCEHFGKARRLGSVASIFTAGLYGVLVAMEYVLGNNIRKAILFAES